MNEYLKYVWYNESMYYYGLYSFDFEIACNNLTNPNFHFSDIADGRRLTGCRIVRWCRCGCRAASAAPPSRSVAVWVSERSLWVPGWWTWSTPLALAGGPGTRPCWHTHLRGGDKHRKAGFHQDFPAVSDASQHQRMFRRIMGKVVNLRWTLRV